MELLFDIVRENSLTRRSINFFDTKPSHKMCFDTSYATIDLKDASDNVSLYIVKLLFPAWVYKLLVRYRTPFVNGTRSSCFATMGSATCFPIETIVFWAISLSAMDIQRDAYRCHTPLKLRVFGDDIIVPLKSAVCVCNALIACGFSVNPDKTCLSTNVRESCGEWVYAGFSSRILKPKNHTITSYVDWLGVIDMAEQALKMGLFNLSSLLKTQAFKFFLPPKRFGKNLQRIERRVPQLCAKRDRQLDGYNGLYAWHVRGELSPFLRGTQLRVKWGWVSDDTKYRH
jgi:hypothetical protein